VGRQTPAPIGHDGTVSARPNLDLERREPFPYDHVDAAASPSRVILRKGCGRRSQYPVITDHRFLSELHQKRSKGTNMKRFFFTTLTAGALASAALGLAGTANAAPAGPSSVDGTVSQLRSQGYQVIVNRVGTAPFDRCTISAVRPGQTFSRTDSGAPGAGQDIVTTVTSRTVYVDVAC